MSFVINKINAIEVLDSRGNPTVEVNLIINTHFKGRGIAPSGASTGTHEALELRDGDKSRYMGKGTIKAVEHVNTLIKQAVEGKPFANVEELEKFIMTLDGTANKSKLGANAILPCGLAFVQAVASCEGKSVWAYLAEGNKVSLPVPYINVINGGSHADNGLDFQKFMLIPQGFSSFHEAIRARAEAFHTLKKLLNEQGITTEQIKLALDVASSEFYKEGKYEISGEGESLSSKEMVQYYVDLISDYPIISIEDGFAEDDFAGWSLCEKTFEEKGLKVRTLGDDLYVTNPIRLQLGIDQQMSNRSYCEVQSITENRTRTWR